MGLIKEKSCGCIIVNRDREILLVCEKRRDNFWGFPKGHIEHDESEVETAMREVKEEVGLEVEVFEEKRYVINYVVDNRIDKTAVFFLAKPKSDNIEMQDEEIADIRWCKLYEALDILTYDNTKELLKKVINDIDF